MQIGIYFILIMVVVNCDFTKAYQIITNYCSSGVYDDHSCSSSTVNHAMLVVGYTKDAWILKNWWGSHWGENGYMRLKRRVNRCGIANYAAYALV